MKLKDLQELRSNAIHSDRYPVYMIEFDADDEPYYVISKALFQYLKEQL